MIFKNNQNYSMIKRIKKEMKEIKMKIKIKKKKKILIFLIIINKKWMKNLIVVARVLRR